MRAVRQFINGCLLRSCGKDRVTSMETGYDSEIKFWEDAIKEKKIEWVEKALNPTTDPLADSYNDILTRLNYSYPIKTIKCYGEDILNHFEVESFDIVYCANALDHPHSPQQCMNNMYKVLKNDGIIYLTGYIREGTNANWTGLHQHDLVPEKDQLCHYDKKGNRTNLTKHLSGLRCIYNNENGGQAGDIYTMIFKKVLKEAL